MSYKPPSRLARASFPVRCSNPSSSSSSPKHFQKESSRQCRLTDTRQPEMQENVMGEREVVLPALRYTFIFWKSSLSLTIHTYIHSHPRSGNNLDIHPPLARPGSAPFRPALRRSQGAAGDERSPGSCFYMARRRSLGFFFFSLPGLTYTVTPLLSALRE